MPLQTDVRRRFSDTELPIPLSSVRLVFRLVDEETGRDRDVIVRHVRGGAPYLQREQNSPLPRHTRYVAGEDIMIPWPEVAAPSDEAQPGDTMRLDVERQTYMPTLYDPPLPQTSILDELRGDKYARDRQWHEDEYVRMKVLEDARVAWFESRKLHTPQEELSEKRRNEATLAAEKRRAKGPSPSTLKIIQQTLEENKRKKKTMLAA
jgi:large subunit ribosomal protein L24